ncbi:MAG: VOC family protein [Bacteroidia bacterium]
MKNYINWFEIPATDFERAVKFYKTLFSCEIQEMELFGSQMGFLPSDGIHVTGAIVQGEDYKPSSNGTLIYLNGGEDLSNMLSLAEANGGEVIVPKTSIGENGFMAQFKDTEGNRIAIHSMQ